MSGDSRTFVLGSPKIYAREHKSMNCYLVVLACTAVHLWSGLQCLSLPQAFPSGPWRPAASRVVTESAEAQLHSKHRTSLFFVELSGPGAAIWSQTFASTWLMRRYALLLCPTYCIHFTKEVSRHSKFQMLFDDDVHTYYIIIVIIVSPSLVLWLLIIPCHRLQCFFVSMEGFLVSICRKPWFSPRILRLSCRFSLTHW